MKNDTQRHQIILSRHPNGWMARHTDPVIRDLFGTDVLPTAFTAEADIAFVTSEIKRMNPNCEVV